MATPRLSAGKAKNQPLQVRLDEVEARFEDAIKRTGLSRPDLVRMALAAFLDTHPTPEAVIEAQIRYRTNLAKQAAA